MFVRAGTAAEIFLGFILVVPLTLFFAWRSHSTLIEPLALTLFCIAFVWLNISILRWQRGLRKLGWTARGRGAFGLGPRPDDPEELDIWQKGAHFRYSFVAVLISMMAFGIVKFINGE
jgi:hypothetical protein